MRIINNMPRSRVLISPESDPERLNSEIEHFSKFDREWWGEKTEAGMRRYEDKLVMFKKFCRPQDGSLVLEIGCGSGVFTKRLLRTNISLVATDITRKQIERCRNKIKSKNVQFRVENAEKLRFKNDLFDVVCGVSILHHLNPEMAIQEAYRVLKKDGQIFFTEPNLLNPQIYFGLKWFRKKMQFSKYETALLRWQTQGLLRKVGFREYKVANYGFLHPHTPGSLINIVERLERRLERTPLIKEISGSLLIWAKK